MIDGLLEWWVSKASTGFPVTSLPHIRATSRLQKYRLTDAGKRLLTSMRNEAKAR